MGLEPEEVEEKLGRRERIEMLQREVEQERLGCTEEASGAYFTMLTKA